MNTEFISIKDIMSEIYEHPMMGNISEERIIRDTLELIKVINNNSLFEDKEGLVHISKHKGNLPCDYYDIHQVVLFKDMEEFNFTNKSMFVELDILQQKLNNSTDSEEIKQLNDRIQSLLMTIKTSAKGYLNKALHEKVMIPIKPATSTFSPMNIPSNDLVYKIQGKIITTSLSEGDIAISYKAIKVDDEGYPLIINNASFIRALKAYIKKNWFTILFDENKINSYVLQNAQNEYYTFIAQAQNALQDFTPEKAEIVSRILNNPFIDSYEWNYTYKDLNKINAYKLH